MIPSVMPFPTLFERVNNGQYEMVVMGFSWGFDGLQGDKFRCDALAPTGFNWMSYCNPEYDELDRAAMKELDPEARRELLIEASNILNDEMAIGVMFFSQSIYGASPRVKNFFPEGYSAFWWIRYTWFEEEA